MRAATGLEGLFALPWSSAVRACSIGKLSLERLPLARQCKSLRNLHELRTWAQCCPLHSPTWRWPLSSGELSITSRSPRWEAKCKALLPLAIPESWRPAPALMAFWSRRDLKGLECPFHLPFTSTCHLATWLELHISCQPSGCCKAAQLLMLIVCSCRKHAKTLRITQSGWWQ